MVFVILEPFSPAPARFLNRGLVIPMETIVATFLWKLLLETLTPVPLTPPVKAILPLAQVPRACARVAWKFRRRALFLTAPTPPMHERTPLEQLAPHDTVILTGTPPPLAPRQTMLLKSPRWRTLTHSMNLPSFLLVRNILARARLLLL